MHLFFIFCSTALLVSTNMSSALPISTAFVLDNNSTTTPTAIYAQSMPITSSITPPSSETYTPTSTSLPTFTLSISTSTSTSTNTNTNTNDDDESLPEVALPPPFGTPSTTTNNNAPINDNHDDNDFQARAWINPATYSLVCYDVVIGVLFVWCWASGWFWWWRNEGNDRAGVRTRMYEVEIEMEDWENRRRGSRRGRRWDDERDVEGQMRRLGMI